MLNADCHSVSLDLYRLAGVVAYCVKLNSVLRAPVNRPVRYRNLMRTYKEQSE